MNEEKLILCIEKILALNPKDSNAMNKYAWKNWLIKFCRERNIDDNIIDESVNVYFEKDIFSKPMVYLRAICEHKQKEMNQKRTKELRQLGSVPSIIMPNANNGN